ncbi:sec-independent protein translocase protein TatC [Lachnospiraceae bacterium KH1T2]|nr:sec-independent protein translocase protein TatC [Lachnospiraceae bacterium KH1T2]
MSKSKESHENDGNMSLSAHLRELRNRIGVCLVFLMAAMFVGLYFAGDLVQLFLELGEKYNYEFVYITPQELLIEYFSLAFVFAVVLTFPIILYQIWAFMTPGMEFREKVFFLGTFLFGLIFAALGVLFAGKILIPFMLKFLIDLSAGTGVKANISVQSYISFLITIFIIFAVIFELPIVSVILTQLGILKTAWMKKGRKFVIILIFFVAAVITPPDVVSQVMTAIPMLFLYEFSIVLCDLLGKLKHS